MLVYIEHVSRRHGVSQEAFHKIMFGQAGWASEHEDDQLLLMIGRTWRIGPEPEYMCIWYTPGSGLERLDAWESVFRSGAADSFQEPFRLAGRIDRAGCYDTLIEPVASSADHFYAEFFDIATGADRVDVSAAYEARASHADGIELCILVDRIGFLGPDPRGLAIWSVRDWGALETIARGPRGEGPTRTVTSALYSPIGTETL